jgi:hypothetical protein
VANNPFEYTDPLPAAQMVGRRRELGELTDLQINSHNCRLIGPRRYGKTTLVNAALAMATNEGLPAINVNFFGVLTLEDIAERIERAYSEQLDGALKRWFVGVLRTLRPTLSTGVGMARVGVSPQAPTASLLDRLSLPRKILEKHGVRSVIAFDEFQDVLRASSNADAVIRSEIEKHAGVAGYVFAGSHVGMMRELFGDRRRAFYAQAADIELEPLSPDDLADHISARFQAAGRDAGDALGPLLDLAEGHPQRALMLAHKLYANTPRGSAADSETWSRALEAAYREAEPEIVAVWSELATTAQRVLAVVADGSIAINSRVARERYGLPKTGSNQQAVQQLAGEALIKAAPTPTGWAIVDPFLALWLRNGRRWPGDL